MNLKLRTAISTHVMLALASFFAVFPVLIIIGTSLRAKDQIYQTGKISLFPAAPVLENFREVLTLNNGIFLRWFGNSVLVAGCTAVLGVFLAATAAYAFSRFRFRGRSASLFVFLLTQMFPGAVLLVPLYFMMQRLGLLGSFTGLIIANLTCSLPFGVWMLKSYFDAIPTSLDEAGIVDGLTRFGVFWRIVLPLSLPGVSVTAFFGFLTAWNEYLFALSFMTREENYLLPVGIAAAFGDQYQTAWHLVAAASVLTTLPILAVFVLAQKAIIGGLTAGGVKD